MGVGAAYCPVGGAAPGRASSHRFRKLEHEVRQAGQEFGEVCRSQRTPSIIGTDANAIQLSRAGVATGLLSVPQRYMHTPVEIVALDDLDNTAKLLAEFALSVDANANFIP